VNNLGGSTTFPNNFDPYAPATAFGPEGTWRLQFQVAGDAAIPEPTSYILLASGLLSLLVMRLNRV
jgi:hypothetical protein